MAKISDLQNLEIVLPPMLEQLKIVQFMDMAQHEIKLLSQLITNKQQLMSTVLNQQILIHKLLYQKWKLLVEEEKHIINLDYL